MKITEIKEFSGMKMLSPPGEIKNTMALKIELEESDFLSGQIYFVLMAHYKMENDNEFIWIVTSVLELKIDSSVFPRFYLMEEYTHKRNMFINLAINYILEKESENV